VIQGATSTVAPFYQAGFGYFAIGGVDFTGDGRPDLAISNPALAQVFVYEYDPVASAMKTTPTQTLSAAVSSAYYGYSMAQGDLNGDAKPDLVVGSYATTSNKTVHIYLNGGPASAPLSLGSILTGSTGFGAGTTVGDFNGDGKPDIAVGAPFDVNGAVYVWY
jgi:hypothetical protein